MIYNREAFEKELERQRKLGYPNFKEAIAKSLVEDYNIEEEKAYLLSISLQLHNDLLEDIAWAQHMGPEYWAEVIVNDLKLS